MPGVAQCQAQDLLREDLPAALDVRAEQPPHPQVDHHAAPTDRRVVDTPLVAAVHSPAGMPAGGTARLGIGGCGVDVYPVSVGEYRFDPHTGQMRKQIRKLHSGHTA